MSSRLAARRQTGGPCLTAAGVSENLKKNSKLIDGKNPEHMFLGEYTHNLDIKGRVAIPAKFRDQLTTGAIITRGLDNCLFIFPGKEWEALAAKLIALPLAQANSRAFVRLMMAGAADVDIDGQGRILLPDYLRRYASLKKQAVIAGLYNRIEIWDNEAWSRYKARTESASDEIAEQLGELGI